MSVLSLLSFSDNVTLEGIEIDIMSKVIAHAVKYSTDPSTQNAAALVKFGLYDNIIGPVLFDANRFPTGVKETEERWKRPDKYYYVEHAERNVILSASNRGIRTSGLTMICPWFACADCARAIIQAGIVKVVGLKADKEATATNQRWNESVCAGDTMLDEAGVVRKYIDIPELGIDVLRNGNKVLM